MTDSAFEQLSRRIAELERRLDATAPASGDAVLDALADLVMARLDSRVATPSIRPPQDPIGRPVAPPPPPETVPSSPPPPTPDQWKDLARLTPLPAMPARRPLSLPTVETVFKWAGVVLVVLAAAFVVGSAIDRGLLSPTAQLAGVVLAGFALVAGGVRLDRTQPRWGFALIHAGVGALAVSALASHFWLDLLAVEAAVVAAVGVGLFTIALADLVGKESLAFAALLTAVAAGLYVANNSAIAVAVLVVSGSLLMAAAVAVSLRRPWPLLRSAGIPGAGAVLLLVATYWYEQRYLEAPDRGAPELRIDQLAILTAGGLIAAMAWFAPRLSARGTERVFVGWKRTDPTVDGPKADSPEVEDVGVDVSVANLDARNVIAVPIASWLLLLVTIPPLLDHQMRSAAGVAAFFGLLVVGFRRNVAGPHWVGQVAGVSVVASAAVLSFDDATATIGALGVQAIGMAVIGNRFSDGLLRANAVALAGAVAAATLWKMTLDDLSSGHPFWQDIAHLAVAVGFVVASRFADVARGVWARVVAVTGIVGIVLWPLRALMDLPQGQALASLWWAVLALFALVFGVMRNRPELTRLGFAGVCIVLAKLIVIDLATVDPMWRAALFCAVGGGLLRVGYVLPNLRPTAARSDHPSPPPPGPHSESMS